MEAVLNKPELIVQLQQLLFDIDNLCIQYDGGDKTVISSLAERMVTIFHNSDKSKSVLNQLKLVKVPMACSSDAYDSKRPVNFIGLLNLEHLAGKGWLYTAKLDKSILVKVAQENWWQHKKVIVDSDNVGFTRAKIVKAVAVSAPVNLNTTGWKLKDAAGVKPIINPIPETIRQIAFELLQSFKNIDLNKESKLHYKL